MQGLFLFVSIDDVNYSRRWYPKIGTLADLEARYNFDDPINTPINGVAVIRMGAKKAAIP